MLARLAVWVSWVCLSIGIGAAQAQTSCSSAGDVSICYGSLGGSVMHRIGDLTLINWPDGATTTMTRYGDFSIVTDSREGMSGTAHHSGDSTILNLHATTLVCTTTGPSTLCG